MLKYYDHSNRDQFPSTLTHLPRSQPAFGLRRQPELCQQAEIAVVQFSVSQNRTDGDLCRGSGIATCQCVAFRAIISAKPGPVGSGNASSTLLRIEKKMAEGSIKRLTDKGFGFIEIAPGQDLFFHSSGVEGTTFDQLYEGQQVSFTEGQGPKGPRAENVKPI